MLSTVGLNNVISNDDYTGAGQDFGKVANIMGQAGKMALPFALQTAGVPMGITTAAQNALGAVGQNESTIPDKKQSNPQMFPNGGKLRDFGSKLNKKLPKNTGRGSEPSIMIFGDNSFAPNAELEKQEVFQTPDGSVQQVDGPTHDSGGIPVNIPNGTRIWSDRLKLKGKTFAKHAAKYKTEKEEETLADTTLSARAKQTAQLNMATKTKKLDELFNTQEAMKAKKINNYIKKYGGTQKYPDGGLKRIDPSIGTMVANDKTTTVPNPIYGSQYGFFPENIGVLRGSGTGAQTLTTPVVGKYVYRQGSYGSTLHPNGQKFNEKGETYVPVYPNGGSFEETLPETLEEVQAQMALNALNTSTSGDVNFFEQAYMNPNNYPGAPVNTNVNEIQTNTPILPTQATLSQPQLNPQINPTVQTLPDNGQSIASVGLNALQKAGNVLGDNKKAIGREAAIFGMNNIANLAYLKNEGKRYDKVDYGKVDPTLMTDEESIKQINQGYNAGLYNLRNTGNLSQSGRVALASERMKQGAAARERIGNVNSGIKNQFNQYNKGLQVQSMQDEAANKGQALTNYYSALGATGQNTAMQTKDYMQRAMDQKKLNLIKDIFPDYQLDPKTLNYYYRLAQKQKGQ
jgi:hypothetical protein